MKGWKTWTGAALASIGGILKNLPDLFPGQEAVGEILLALGAALGGVGIAHKIEKGK